jgi:hypothetical protein
MTGNAARLPRKNIANTDGREKTPRSGRRETAGFKLNIFTLYSLLFMVG